MNKEIVGKLAMEIAWWIITAIVVWIVVEPMWGQYVKYDYIYNCIFDIVMFITLVRYIFLLKYTFLSHFQVGKFILIFASIPLGFYLIQEFFAFHDFVDSEGTEGFQSHFRQNIPTDELYSILKYTTNQILFFGIGAIMSMILFPFRLLVSFWRVYNNTGTV